MNLVAMSSNALTQEIWRCVWGTSGVHTLRVQSYIWEQTWLASGC